ncbi:MAG: phosphonoacetaldehyde hydrolase, partial [Armatimonadota bacterium]
AGAWTVGVIESGNGIGLRREEVAELSEAELARRSDLARQDLQRAGAHYTIPTVADLPPVIEEIEARLRRGERP